VQILNQKYDFYSCLSFVYDKKYIMAHLIEYEKKNNKKFHNKEWVKYTKDEKKKKQ